MESTVQEKEPRCHLEFEEDEDPSNSCVDDETMEPIHSKIPKENIPRVGLEFETEDEAYEFYNAYALMVGFSVRKGSAHRYRGTVLDRILVCSCQGKRGPDKRDNIYKSHRPETRCGCLAQLKISCRHVGKYRVTDFVAKHNHGMASPGIAAELLDEPEFMTEDAKLFGYPFPYLYDETQEVARSFGAVCTPEFLLFKKDGRRPFELVYHGQFDDSRPSSNIPVTGRDLSRTIDCVLSGQPLLAVQKPSVGCSIKWHP